MADPYPAVGSNYRPNFQPSTPNRSLTLTQEEVIQLKSILGNIIDPNTEVISLYDKVSRL